MASPLHVDLPEKSFVLAAILWHYHFVKIASMQQMPSWQDILSWVSAGEEVQITDDRKTVAKVVPALKPPTYDVGKLSAFDLPPIALGRLLMPLTADDDRLVEMLDDSRD